MRSSWPLPLVLLAAACDLAPIDAPLVEVELSGSGRGTVRASTAGAVAPALECGSRCASSFGRGEWVELTAEPDAGSTFEAWTGTCRGRGACAFVATGSVAVGARFELAGPGRHLRVERQGEGTITSEPAGVACGEACEATFGEAERVLLHAEPAPGSILLGWTGECSGNPCVWTSTGSARVGAHFAPALRSLTVRLLGSGAGRVHSTPVGIDCGTTCRADLPTGREVTLEPTPEARSRFVGWGGACAAAGVGPCTLVLDEDARVVALFEVQRFEVGVERSGEGTIISEPAGIDCGQTCSALLPAGASIGLSATPAACWTFTASTAGWSGACQGHGSCRLSLDEAKQVRARFTRLRHTLAVTRSGPGQGAVTASPGGIDCGPRCRATYPCGALVVLTAVPAAGSRFVGWTGACAGDRCAILLDGDKAVGARFE